MLISNTFWGLSGIFQQHSYHIWTASQVAQLGICFCLRWDNKESVPTLDFSLDVRRLEIVDVMDLQNRTLRWQYCWSASCFQWRNQYQCCGHAGTNYNNYRKKHSVSYRHVRRMPDPKCQDCGVVQHQTVLNDETSIKNVIYFHSIERTWNTTNKINFNMPGHGLNADREGTQPFIWCVLHVNRWACAVH